jgi:hypothetical protein
MDSKTISEKLLYPTDSTKKRKIPREENLYEHVSNEIKFFYKTKEQIKQDKLSTLKGDGLSFL